MNLKEYRLSRRDALKVGAIGLLGGIAACAPAVTELTAPAPLEPNTQKPTEEIPTEFSGKYINRSYLYGEGAKIASGLANQPELTPQGTAIPSHSETTKANLSLSEQLNYSAASWGRSYLNITNEENSPLPLLDVIRFAVGNATYNDANQQVWYYQASENGNERALSGLNLYRERLNFSNRTDLSGIYQLDTGTGIQKGLNFKDGSGITVVGRSEEDGNIVVAFEEYFDRKQDEQFQQPRIRFAVLTPDSFAQLSVDVLLNLKYYTNSPSKLTYTDTSLNIDREIELNTLSVEVMKELNKEVGRGWYEQYPSIIENGEVKEYKFFPDPVIPDLDPTRDELPKNFDWQNAKLNIVNLGPDGKNYNYQFPDDPEAAVVFAVDENSGTVLMARYEGKEKKEWKWKEPGLRDFADALSINIGSFIEPNAQYWKNELWTKVVGKEFNTGVNSIYWHNILGNEGEYDFTLPDSQLDVTQKYKMDMRGHALVYGYFTPEWLKNGSHTPDELNNLLKEFITKNMNRYKSINSWVVVNEAGLSNPYSEGDFWFKKLGEKYVESSFMLARTVNPKAQLIYNDFDNETIKSPKYNQTKKIVDTLKQKGLIDAVGLEMHLDASKSIPSKSELVDCMRSYGIPVCITELDVNLKNIGGSDKERYSKQAEIYRLVFEAALESGVCKEISVWGIGDKFSWTEQTEFGGSPNADATLFDDNLHPKAAYNAVVDTLKAKVLSS